MKIVIASDTYEPQINGVVRSLICLLEAMPPDCEYEVIHPGLFRCFHMPFYPELQLAYGIDISVIEKMVSKADYIHILTEGSVGLAVRQYCLAHHLRFTTSYLTKLPEYIKEFTYVIPEAASRWVFRWFHSAASKVLVTTQTMRQHLQQHNFNENVVCWQQGLDTVMFSPQKQKRFVSDKPIALYAGRVSKEKNLEAFLSCPVSMQKMIVGDGPIKKQLEKKYPDVIFTGYLRGPDLCQAYSDADVFVFPSRTDTFGLVMLEALACGTPVAGYPVGGPLDVIGNNSEIGCLDDDLEVAIHKALKANRQKCREFAMQFSWEKSAESFLKNLVPKGDVCRKKLDQYF